MQEYLLYCFEGSQFVRCDVFHAADDEKAIETAIERHDGRVAELWTGSRKVKSFPKDGDDAEGE